MLHSQRAFSSTVFSNEDERSETLFIIAVHYALAVCVQGETFATALHAHYGCLIHYV